MLAQNYFVLFDLPETFLVDNKVLAHQYRQLQKSIHPDKFAGHTEQEQRLAVQFASYVNQAYDCLRSPLKRAVYLLQLRGLHSNFEQMTTADTQFLTHQMVWREQLMDVRQQPDPGAALTELKADVDKLGLEIQDQFAQNFAAGNYVSAQQDVAKLHFVCKLLADIHQYEDQLFNEF